MPRKAKKSADPPTAAPSIESAQPDQTETLAESSAGASNQRDPQGRYLKNNAGGPGNPHARHCARMLEMFRNSITDEEMYGLCRVLYERAITGDMSALKMIWQYKLGKPLPAPNPDMIDRDEWDHFQKDAMTLDEMKKVLGQLPSRIGNAIVSAALPSIASTISHSLAQQLLQGLPEEYLANQSNGSASSEPKPVAEHSSVDSSLPSTIEEDPISNGDLPPLDADGLPVRTYRHTPPAKHSSPVSNGKSTAHSKGEAPAAPSRAPRHAALATRSPVSNGNSTAHSKGEAPAAPSLAPRHAALATRSPVSNGKLKRASKRKKARKAGKDQWLEPIARKCQAAQKRRQRVSA
jgi:hypothetical protein